MISFLKELWQDRRGNAIVIVAGALPLVIGSAGLATDTIQWALWKRQIQRAADSAAMAGVYADVNGDSYSDAAINDIAKYTQSGFVFTTANRQITQPTVAGFNSAVQVSLTVQRALTFSSMFLTNPPSITAVATAALSKEGNYCVVALNNTAAPSIIINGNVTMNFGCGIISNSTSTSSSQTAGAIAVSGNAHIVNATPIAGAGVVPAINGTNTEMSYQLQQSDPYANQYSTVIPTTGNYATPRNLAGHVATKNQTVTHNSQVYKVIDPGTYISTGNPAAQQAFNTQGDYIAMNPGTYYINSANWEVGANSKIIVNPSATTDEGVTIVLTGANPGVVNVASNAQVNLRAPNGAETEAYHKMLFVQKPGATGTSTISGNSSSAYDGTFYFPSTTVSYTGGASDTFKCAMIVGWIVEFSGNTNLQNNTTGCYANQQEQIDKVRLIG